MIRRVTTLHESRQVDPLVLARYERPSLESMTQPQGLGFTVGGIAGGLALQLFVVAYPVGRRMIALSDRLERSGARRATANSASSPPRSAA